MRIDPYLFFEGSCETALAFYGRHLGADVTAMMRFGEAPEPPPGVPADKIMHASFTVGDTRVLASDGHCSGQPALNGFALTLTAPDVATADRLYGLLGEGGLIRMPITETFFSPRFGIVVDKFGVTWMVMVEPPAHS